MGVPFFDTLLKTFGKMPSRLAARGICPCSKIQPFNAPKQEMIAPIPTTYPAQEEFQIIPAASANGAVDVASC